MLLTDGKQVVRPADYIGSFLVAGKGHQDRAEVVRQKLETAQAYTHSKPILLYISLNGIKVCRETNEHVYMAHALRRISYATCDPENLQFAFLAREPKAQSNVQYCHAFVTATAAQAEELNNIVGEAFRLAYAEQQQHQQPAKTNCPPAKTVDNATHQPASGPPVLVPAGPSVHSNIVVSSSSSQLLLQAHQPRLPPDHVIHKPLPPVPHEVKAKPCDGELGNMPSTSVSSHLLSPSAPPSTPVLEVAGKASAGGRHEHRVHKHHKHRRHRHRPRLGEAPDHSDSRHPVGIPTQRDFSTDSQRGSLHGNDAGVPLDRDTQAVALGGVDRPASELGFTSPPEPPPRGLSQACPPSHEAIGNGDNPSISVNGDEHVGCNREVLLISSGMQDKCRLEADMAKSRPLSDVFTTRYSPHFYDMAEHQSCVPAESAQTPVEHLRRLSQPLLPALVGNSTTASVTVAMTTTMTTATTTATTSSSASPFSDGSVGSLPPVVFTPLTDGNREPGGMSACLHSPPAVLARDALELANAAWYQPGLSRDTVVEMLLRMPSGSFVIRDSASHSNCYALSVRFGSEPSSRPVTGDMCHRLSAAVTSGLSTPQHLSKNTAVNSVYPQVSGICHFLIERTVRRGVRLKGLEKEWPTLPCLVLHLTVMPEMLPCPLRLPTTSSGGVGATPAAGGVNPAFRANDQPAGVHFRPIDGAEPGNQVVGARGSNSTDIGEDYQCLSDFSSIMADLQPRTRLGRHKSHQVVSRS